MKKNFNRLIGLGILVAVIIYFIPDLKNKVLR